jgi:hypothetical protein
VTRAAQRGLGVLMAALAVALAAAALAVVAAHAAGPSLPRCYWIDPPISHYQPRLLNSGWLDCSLQECRAAVRQNAEAGWVCFFQRPWG